MSLQNSSYVNVESVRDFIADASATEGLGELNFTDEEIVKAMASAARDFNSILPYSTSVTAARMSADTNLFFDATAYHLYRSEYARLSREDVDYTAGDVQTNPAKNRMANLLKLMTTHDERFREPATKRKIAINMSHAYGPVG